MYQTEEKKRRAILINICLNTENYEETKVSMKELELLAETAGIETITTYIQKKHDYSASILVGSGFLENIMENHKDDLPDLLIFDRELSPTQIRNIEKVTKVDVSDRTEIILRIFSEHARSKEAKLQTRLAELKYQLPRLRRMWTHLDSQTGSSRSGGGMATRGMGEKQINKDKSRLRLEISNIEEELGEIMKQKDTQAKNREKYSKRVCLAGYTNAGKSTLFNALTDAGVLVEDKLFATLDPTSRKLELDKGHDLILSDTVGFISNLPHGLVASFRATLKETLEADLLLHIIDISDANYQRCISSVDAVLEEIGAANVRRLSVFNKIDLLENPEEQLFFLKNANPEAVCVSAVNKTNINLLLKTIDEIVFSSTEYKLLLPHTEHKLLSTLYQIGKVVSCNFINEGAEVTAIINSDDLRIFEKYLVEG